MKSIRTMLLVFAVTVVPFMAQRALAQQEVDPDHFDHPAAAKPVAKQQSNKVAVHDSARSNANLASKQAKQHHSRVSASATPGTVPGKSKSVSSENSGLESAAVAAPFDSLPN